MTYPRSLIIRTLIDVQISLLDKLILHLDQHDRESRDQVTHMRVLLGLMKGNVTQQSRLHPEHEVEEVC